MFESLKETLAKWNASTDARVKLQHVYITASVALVFVAGIIGLINHGMGQNILVVAIISAGVFLANAVVWALLQSAVLARIPRRPASARARKRK